VVLVVSPYLSLSPSAWTLTSVDRAIVKGLCHPLLPLAIDGLAHSLGSVDTQEEITVAQVSGKLNKDLWREFNKYLVAVALAQLRTPWRYLHRQFTTACKDVRSKCAPCTNLHSYDNMSLSTCATWRKDWHSDKEIITVIALSYCIHYVKYHFLQISNWY